MPRGGRGSGLFAGQVAQQRGGGGGGTRGQRGGQRGNRGRGGGGARSGGGGGSASAGGDFGGGENNRNGKRGGGGRGGNRGRGGEGKQLGRTDMPWRGRGRGDKEGGRSRGRDRGRGRGRNFGGDDGGQQSGGRSGGGGFSAGGFSFGDDNDGGNGGFITGFHNTSAGGGGGGGGGGGQKGGIFARLGSRGGRQSDDMSYGQSGGGEDEGFGSGRRGRGARGGSTTGDESGGKRVRGRGSKRATAFQESNEPVEEDYPLDEDYQDEGEGGYQDEAMQDQSFGGGGAGGGGGGGRFQRNNADDENNTTLFIPTVPQGFNTNEALLEHFSQFGEVTSVLANYGRARAAALIKFARREEAEQAMQLGRSMNQQRIKLSWARQSIPMPGEGGDEGGEGGFNDSAAGNEEEYAQTDDAAYGDEQYGDDQGAPPQRKKLEFNKRYLSNTILQTVSHNKRVLAKQAEERARAQALATDENWVPPAESMDEGDGQAGYEEEAGGDEALDEGAYGEAEGEEYGEGEELGEGEYAEEEFDDAAGGEFDEEGGEWAGDQDEEPAEEAPPVAAPPSINVKGRLGSAINRNDTLLLSPQRSDTLVLPPVPMAVAAPPRIANLATRSNTVPVGGDEEDNAKRASRFGLDQAGNDDDYKPRKRKPAVPGADKVALEDAAPPMVGLCMDKCPVNERHARERQQDLSVFEMEPGTEHPQERGQFPRVRHEWAVKKFRRPAAGEDNQPPEDVRPPPILIKTLDYLFTQILDRTDKPFSEVQKFVRDRTRSIRQDLVLQDIRDEVAVALTEKIARFHIFSEHRCCEYSVVHFDTQQNVEQMTKCFISLKQFYDDLAEQGIHTPNEGEFRSYVLLMNIKDVESPPTNLHPSVYNSAHIQLALAVSLCYKENNYARFFKLVAEAPYLSACLLHKFFPLIRFRALQTMNRVYNKEPFPIEDLINLLGFEDEEEATKCCEFHGLPVSKINGRSMVLWQGGQLGQPEFNKWTVRMSNRLIEAKVKGIKNRDITEGRVSAPVALSTRAVSRTVAKPPPVAVPVKPITPKPPAEKPITPKAPPAKVAPTQPPVVAKPKTPPAVPPSPSVSTLQPPTFGLPPGGRPGLPNAPTVIVPVTPEPPVREKPRRQITLDLGIQIPVAAPIDGTIVALPGGPQGAAAAAAPLPPSTPRTPPEVGAQQAARESKLRADAEAARQKREQEERARAAEMAERAEKERQRRERERLEAEAAEARRVAQYKKDLQNAEATVVLSRKTRYFAIWNLRHQLAVELRLEEERRAQKEREQYNTFLAAFKNVRDISVSRSSGERADQLLGARSATAMKTQSPISIHSLNESTSKRLKARRIATEEREEAERRPLNLPQYIYQPLLQVNTVDGVCPELVFKLLVSVPDKDPAAPTAVDSRWLLAKLSHGGPLPKAEKIVNGVHATVLSRYLYEPRGPSHGGARPPMAVCVKVVSGQPDTSRACVQALRRHAAATSGIVFLLPGPMKAYKKDDWRAARARLRAMASGPAELIPVLVLVQAEGRNLSDQQLTKQLEIAAVELELEKLCGADGSDALISSWIIQPLDDLQQGEENQAHPFSELSLAFGLQWMVEEVEPRPVIEAYSVAATVDEHVESVLMPFLSRQPQLGLPPLAACEDMVQAFNKLIEASAATLSSDHLTSIDWPPSEFSGLLREELPMPRWNTKESMDKLRQSILAHALPPFTVEQPATLPAACKTLAAYVSAVFSSDTAAAGRIAGAATTQLRNRWQGGHRAAAWAGAFREIISGRVASISPTSRAWYPTSAGRPLGSNRAGAAMVPPLSDVFVNAFQQALRALCHDVAEMDTSGGQEAPEETNDILAELHEPTPRGKKRAHDEESPQLAKRGRTHSPPNYPSTPQRSMASPPVLDTTMAARTPFTPPMAVTPDRRGATPMRGTPAQVTPAHGTPAAGAGAAETPRPVPVGPLADLMARLQAERAASQDFEHMLHAAQTAVPRADAWAQDPALTPGWSARVSFPGLREGSIRQLLEEVAVEREIARGMETFLEESMDER